MPASCPLILFLVNNMKKNSMTLGEYRNIRKISNDFSKLYVNDENQKKIVSKIMKRKFYDEGREEPKCVNFGCNNKVTCREWKYWSFKSECNRCMTARKEKRYIIEENIRYFVDKKGKKLNVIMHKEVFCENHDGHLGFKCPVPHENWSGFESGLDLDHVDGNHYNNDPSNVRTYCKLCHGKKSIESGDCNSNKSSARSFNVL
jgi:hypothetical protein